MWQRLSTSATPRIFFLFGPHSPREFFFLAKRNLCKLYLQLYTTKKLKHIYNIIFYSYIMFKSLSGCTIYSPNITIVLKVRSGKKPENPVETHSDTTCCQDRGVKSVFCNTVRPIRPYAEQNTAFICVSKLLLNFVHQTCEPLIVSPATSPLGHRVLFS